MIFRKISEKRDILTGGTYRAIIADDTTQYRYRDIGSTQSHMPFYQLNRQLFWSFSISQSYPLY